MQAHTRRTFLLGSVAAGVLAGCSRAPGRSDSIGPLLAPSVLAGRLADVRAGKIAVLYVGPDLLFDLGHVPGARKVSPAGEPDGYRAVMAALRAIPAETEIVLYCGCCPVHNCPNVRPASAALKELGRPHAHVLDLPTSFVADWSDKGFPVEPA